MSFLRSSTRTKPSASIAPTSPERQKPSLNSRAVAAGSSQ
jgi:hypothetical protein